MSEISFVGTLNQLLALGYQPEKILDIGCNAGNWTAQMAGYFPKAKFTMIDSMDHPKRINAPFIQAILSDKEGEVDWFEITGGNGTGNSYLKEVTSHYSNTPPIKRACTTLNALFDSNLLSNDFDFIKIDCQGAELDILRGASKFIGSAHVILLEVPFAVETNAKAPKFLDYIIFMNDIGFVVFDIIEVHRHQGVLCQIDIVFIKKDSEVLKRTQSIVNGFGT